MTAPQDLTGQRFGRLTVVELDSCGTGEGRIWKCRCDCGTLIVHRTAYLNAGRRKSCGCLPLEERVPRPAPLIMHRFWDRMQRLAKRRRIPFEVSAQHIQNLYEQQEGKCALSGVSITLPKTGNEARYAHYSASLDRIDSTKPYIEGNVQWVHKTVNMLKQNLPEQDLVLWCSRIVSHRLSKTDSKE